MRTRTVSPATTLLLGVGAIVALSAAATRGPGVSQAAAAQATTCESCEEVILGGGKESWDCVPGGFKDCEATTTNCTERNPCPGVASLEERLAEYEK